MFGLQEGEPGIVLVASPVKQFTAGGVAKVCRSLPYQRARKTATPGVEAEEREGSAPLDRPHRPQLSWADTVGSIEREVVSGHDYAILALGAVCGVRGGYDKPAFVSVDGV